MLKSSLKPSSLIFYLYYNKHTYGALEKAESLIFFGNIEEDEEDKRFQMDLKWKFCVTTSRNWQNKELKNV